MRDNIWGGLLLESVCGGGYLVREWPLDPSRQSTVVFACSTMEELLKFIGGSLVRNDVALTSTPQNTGAK